jgi:holo-[acyl-carrier protein] synthase
MAVRIGFDLVSVDEVRESVRVHGARYLERVYTSQELRDCDQDPRLLAAAFAAKEATMKALHRGGDPVPWSSIALTRAPAGRASVTLRDQASELARRRGVRSLSLALSHRRSLAAALVLAEVES